MLYYILIILLYLCFAYLAKINLKLALYLVCATLPTYLIRFTVFGIPATLLEGMIWILFIAWLIKERVSLNSIIWYKNLKAQKNNNQNAIPKILRLPTILLLVASTISIFVSPNFVSAAGIWKAYFIEPIMFLLVFVYNIKTGQEIQNVIKALSLTALVIGIFAVIQQFTGFLIPNTFWAAEATRRITTFFGYPNANGLFLVPVIFLNFSNLLTDKKILSQAFNLVVIIFSILAIIWTVSTGAIVGLIAGLGTILLLYKKTRLLFLIACFTALLFIVFSPALPAKIGNTIFLASQTKLPLVPTDWQMRAQIWRETSAMIKDHPILGAGLDGYQTTVAPYHVNKHIEVFLYPHNFFLNFWSETGLLGLISIMWILIAFFILTTKLLKTHNILTFSLISAMIALLVQGLVDAPYFKNDLSVLFWIIIGIAIVLDNQSWRSAGVVERDTLEKC